MPELKMIDCPFCGAPDVGGLRVAGDDAGELYVAFCDKCEAQGPHTKGNAQDAIRAWNKAQAKPRPMSEAPTKGRVRVFRDVDAEYLIAMCPMPDGWLPLPEDPKS